MKQKLLALLLSLSMLGALPALAAEDAEPQMQPISPWAYDAMSEVAALGMWDDQYYYSILDPVTDQQLDKLCTAVAGHLALLGKPARPLAPEEAGLAVDLTRGGVINRLYQEAASWALDGLELTGPDLLHRLGVVQGDERTDYAYDRPCTLQEALVMAQRLVLSVYDRYGAGSQGFLWRARGGGSTLYLLGTIHVDRDNIYPFSKQLRDIIAGADDAIFEVDFGDVEDATAFVAMQYYPQGEGMADHVSPELYQRAVAAGAALPPPYTMDQAAVNSYKPWAFANMVNSVSLLIGEENIASPMAVDAYVYSKAANNGVSIDAVETYVYQGGLFDSLSKEYQEGYLSDILDSLDAVLSGDAASSDVGQITRWVGWWKERDVSSFTADYSKDDVLTVADELNELLLVERDPGMIAYADNYLKAGQPRTGILVVGAAHMVGDSGIVQGLRNLGYTVDLMPVA